MNAARRLQHGIRDLRGLDADHVESVLKMFKGKMVKAAWMLFRVGGHPTATHVSALRYEHDDGKLRHLAGLRIPSIDSPQNVVAMLAHIKKQARVEG